MFENIGFGEILVLVLVGLFVLGPERLPAAASWLGSTVRQIRDYATGARDQLRNDLGPEFDQLRQPLEDLRSVRDLDPRLAVRRHLFEDPPPAAVVKPVSRPIDRSEQPLRPGEQAPYDSDAT